MRQGPSRQRNTKRPARRIFVSHASADESLVKAFTRLISGGLGLLDAVFCSSIPDLSIGPGEDFTQRIWTELKSAPISVLLLTPNYYESAFCMAELGAVWGLGRPFIPFLCPPLDYRDLEAPLQGTQAFKLTKSDHLDLMRDRLLRAMHFRGYSTARWVEERATFLEGMEQTSSSFDRRLRAGKAMLGAGVPIPVNQIPPLLYHYQKGEELWVLLFDVDKQNQINRTFGYSFGSTLLEEIGRLLDRLPDTIALARGRCGDDTFFVIAIGSESRIADLAKDILKSINELPREKNWNASVTASAGIAKISALESIEPTFRRAYASCVGAQNQGGGVVGQELTFGAPWS